MSDIKLKDPRSKDFVVDWSYGERQAAQEILPFLFLGPLAAARDKAFLESNKITMVLGVRKLMGSFKFNPKAPRDLGLDLQFVDIKNEAGVIYAFNEVVGKINEHLEQRFIASNSQRNDQQHPPGRVLVFCESGNDRSATAMAAYLMAMYGVNVVEAIQIIQGQRFCIDIDSTARNTLVTYGTMLQAQVDVLGAGHQQQQQQLPLHPPSTTSTSSGRFGHIRVLPLISWNAAVGKPKRNADQMQDDGSDTDMTDTATTLMDETFKRRAGNAPFFDGSGDDNDSDGDSDSW